MSARPTTLVTAAAGKTGRHTALSLLSRGVPVRAMVHREDGRSEAGTTRGVSGMARAMRLLAKSVVAPSPNRKRYLRTFQAGAAFGELSIDSEQWQVTHDPDRAPDVQHRSISTISAVSR